MDRQDLERWLKEHAHDPACVSEARAALLPHHRLVWNYFSESRDGGVANVQYDPTSGDLPGVALWVDDSGLEALDVKEGHPHSYSRGQEPIEVRLLATGERLGAWLYKVNASEQSPGFVPPRRAYRDIVVRGAESFRLPEDHVQTLRSVCTAD